MHNQSQQEQIQRGMELAARLPDVIPNQASERIAEAYDEIQATLRIPIVNLIFRVLANYPDYLEQAWRTLRPALGTRTFERSADGLRAAALLEPVPGSSEVQWEQTGDLDCIRAFNDTIHYVLPKLLLIATALDELSFRPAPESPRTGPTPPDSSQIPLGVAEGTTKVKMVEPEKANERLRGIFESIKARHDHPLVSSYYRGLGNWPDFLDPAWTRVQPLVGSEAYEARKGALIAAARAAIRELPITGPATGPGEAQRAEIRDLLAAFRLKFIPEMLLDVTLIKALVDGPAQARISRFTLE
jgi:hypothetical protein